MRNQLPRPAGRLFRGARLALLLVASLGAGAAARPARAATSFSTSAAHFTLAGSGTETELFQQTGAGCLDYFWFGGAFPDYGLTRIRVYVDGESQASIDVPLMLGHGIGFQDDTAPWGVRRIGKTGSPSGIYDTFRIPFGSSVRVTAEPAATAGRNVAVWYTIRGETSLPIVVGGITLPATARLHAYLNENVVVQPYTDLRLCQTSRSGVVYLVTVAGQSSNLNYLEGEALAFVGGSSNPVVLSSGTEDYFLGTYYFNRGLYHTEVAGLTHLDTGNNSFSGYRFHDDDPVFFSQGLVLDLQCGNHAFGNPQPTTYSSCTWTYEW